MDILNGRTQCPCYILNARTQSPYLFFDDRTQNHISFFTSLFLFLLPPYPIEKEKRKRGLCFLFVWVSPLSIATPPLECATDLIVRDLRSRESRDVSRALNVPL